MGGAVEQADADHHVVLGAGDRARLVLILVVVAVKEGPLLVAVRRVVEGVAAEHVVIVLVRVVRQNAIDPHPDHFQERMVDPSLVASIGQRLGQSPGQPNPLVQLAKRQQPRVAGNWAAEGSTTIGLDLRKSKLT
jgi:hypothetical protein